MKKRVYVITGGGSGLGLASARCLASEGRLLLCDLRPEALEVAKAELTSFGADVETYQVDVSDKASTEACAAHAATLGDVYAVVHAAGVSPANTPRDTILRVNGLGPINMVQAFYPVLSEGGVMICFGSTAGYGLDTNPKMAAAYDKCKAIYRNWDKPDFLDQLRDFLVNDMQLPEAYQAGMAYSVTKNFVKHWVISNVWRFAKKGCRILSVSPGSYLTPMHQALIDNAPAQAEQVMTGVPMQRWGHPYEMGKLIAFLCSPGAGYITGVDILPDGGCTLAATEEQIPE